jgi:hypothetical protein
MFQPPSQTKDAASKTVASGNDYPVEAGAWPHRYTRGDEIKSPRPADRAQFEGAKVLELPGADSLPYASDSIASLDTVEELLTGRLPRPTRPGARDDIVHRYRQLDRAGGQFG